jgi:glutaminyl-peptide cyclotransferase
MRKFLHMRAVIFFFSLALAFTGSSSCSEKGANNAAKPANNSTNANVNSAANKSTSAITKYNYEIVNTFDHDPSAFTEGLQFYNGFLYESTGGKTGDNFSSSVRKVDLRSGKVLQKFDLSKDYFGEGLTILNGKIYQLTWQERTCFVYDLETFKLLKEFKFDGDGWGLTNDGKNIIMTDSTHVIRFMDPENFKLVKTLPVFDAAGQPLMAINELEYIKGEIWANIWQKDVIVRIDPGSGKLLGTIDFSQLAGTVRDKERRSDVLNGIAYDETADRIFVTGKMWKKLYEIKVVPPPQQPQ